jgi:hypothetical protein
MKYVSIIAIFYCTEQCDPPTHLSLAHFVIETQLIIFQEVAVVVIIRFVDIVVK